ncbi:hypothetical protein BN2476_1230065 [Paraburkholderia piptadeniae]|uniref:Uncharacterized protein n=1 Tax=Paraburkholderia piptadeniae TaxID=1701573 RepID=A0A1N7SW05_9BURK|nr:hypothetical protein BN2476_1230065 [Paraburkholderia piptadeniae]
MISLQPCNPTLAAMTAIAAYMQLLMDDLTVRRMRKLMSVDDATRMKQPGDANRDKARGCARHPRQAKR